MPRLDALRDRDGSACEMFWVQHCDYLLLHGYLLRPRYQPDWIPARLKPENKTRAKESIILGTHFEDEVASYGGFLLDATRRVDGSKVVIKRAKKSDHAMLRYLNNPENSSDPKNHAIPLLDSFPIPRDDHVFVVVPFMRVFSRTQFHCRKEFAEAFRQILEGLTFMHKQNIAHGDACTANFLMDCTEVYPQSYHWAREDTLDGTPQTVAPHIMRCQVATPVRYYLIDFEGALSYPDGKQHALAKGAFCQIKTSPEWHSRAPYNPFSLDVYNVGATFLAFCECNDSDDSDHLLGLEDFKPLFLSMTATNPSDRPTMAQSLDSLESFIASKDADWLNGLLTKHESLKLPAKRVEREGLWEKFSKLIPIC